MPDSRNSMFGAPTVQSSQNGLVSGVEPNQPQGSGVAPAPFREPVQNAARGSVMGSGTRR